MKQNKVFKLNGGMAVPLDDKKRLFYLSGAKHEQGGIDVTPELEAEGGEVIKVNPKSIKVVTAQKIMGGKSPAELVVDASSTGEQDKVFNKVFKYQEDFKDRYNLNDDGTKKARWGIFNKLKDINVKDKLKDIAYKIISQDNVSDEGKAGIVDIVKGLFNDKPKDDDNKKMFLYGNVNGLPPADTTKGKDFTKYVKENYPDKKISQYEGVINPYNEYVIDEKYKDTVTELAKQKKHIYSTLEDEYIDYIKLPHPDVRTDPEVKFIDTPYKDDVHSYPLQFDLDDKGNVIAHAADLYDFNYKDYLKNWQFLKAAEAAMLTKIGQPYILRQNNIPVSFIDLGENSDYSTVINHKGRGYNPDLSNRERRAINFNHILKYKGYEKRLGGEMKNKKKALVGTQQPFIFTPLLERNKPTLTRIKSPFDVTNKFGITTNTLTGETYYPDAFNYNNSPYSTYNVKTGKTSYNNLLGDIKLDYKKQSTSGKNKNGNERTPILSTKDLIIGGINLGGSLIDLAVKHSLPVKSVKYNNPIPFTAIKNKTKININPELQELENTINKYKDSINQNTSSSQVALNRSRNINLEKLNRINKLYGYKENKETELINENNRNLQNIINANIQQKNPIDQKNLENEIQTMNLNRLQRTDDITDFVQNIAGTAGNIVSNIEQREQFDKNLAAMIMGYENINAEEKYKLIQELTKKNKRIKRSKKE